MKGALLAAAMLLGAAAPEGSVLEGAVVDEAGNPVGNAAVLVLPAKDGEPEPPAEFTPPAVARPGDPGDRVPVWNRTKVRADSEGRFRVEGLGAGDCWVVASFEGMREAWVRTRPGAEGVTVRVPGLREISGRCLDETTGEPVAGLSLWYGGAYDGGWVTLLEEPTDAQGRFRLTGLLPGRWVLRFGGLSGGPVEDLDKGYRTDYLEKRLPDVAAGRTGLEVRMSRGLSISGRVVDDLGEPVAGISVGLKGQSASGGESGGWGRGAVTGPDGSFRLDGLTEGLYGVAAGAKAERGDWMSKFGGGDKKEKNANARYVGAGVDRVAAGSSDVVVRVSRVVTITGTAVDEEGRPYHPDADNPMYVNLADGPLRGASLGLKATLHQDGRFTTVPLDPKGLYDIVLFRGQGLGSGAARGVRAGSRDVLIRVRRGRGITGTVVDEEGRPVGPGVPVESVATGLAEGEPGGHRRATTAEDGTFSLEDMAEMSVVLTAGGGASAFLPTPDEHEFLPGEGGVRLVARRGAALAGRLIDAEGRPVRAAWIAAGGGEVFPCAEDGAFRIGGLAPGKVRLSAWIGDGVVDLGVVEAPAADLRVPVPAKSK